MPAAQNLKPAVKTRPHHGGGGPANSTNLIKNRYQQTWHTIEFSNNRHTRHHPNQRSGSLRSNFSNLPALSKLCKSAFPRFSLAGRSPARPRHTVECAIFQAVRKGVGRYFSASAAATRKTLHGRRGACKSTPRRHASGAWDARIQAQSRSVPALSGTRTERRGRRTRQ
jgi:hypothetical protein